MISSTRRLACRASALVPSARGAAERGAQALGKLPEFLESSCPIAYHGEIVDVYFTAFAMQ
jgi:hypothetical protein